MLCGNDAVYTAHEKHQPTKVIVDEDKPISLAIPVEPQPRFSSAPIQSGVYSQRLISSTEHPFSDNTDKKATKPNPYGSYPNFLREPLREGTTKTPADLSTLTRIPHYMG